MLEDILLQVNKPARYIGQEWNVSRKDFTKADIRFALCFPDLYEVGMSNLGTRIIYGILNKIEDTCCERFFSPDIDMQRLLVNNQQEIFSLESKRRLKEFDIIGFSLASELSYTNVLNILELGSIPLEATLRNQNCPLVIGGGPCTLNPEPMHKFFDLFVIGEAEDLILELIDVYRKYKKDYKSLKLSKQDLCFEFSNIQGIYAPSLYEVIYSSKGVIEEFKPKIKGAPIKIKKHFIKDLNSSFYPSDWIVPYIQTIHDRVILEIMRGCPNACRFCQSRSGYFPFRTRSVENICELAYNTYKQTGYEELSLGGLSVSDYPYAQELLMKLSQIFKAKTVALSLPSIKPKTLVRTLASIIGKVKKTSLTFAPEAGTERLRKILAKDFCEQEFFEIVEQAYILGYQHLKLYFMIGLPYEEIGDLDGIIDLSNRVLEQVNPAPACRGWVNISINTFIPKPHTPFQWFGMQDLENIEYKQNYLRNKIRSKRLILKFHNRYMSFLEGVLSRGDRRLSQLIYCAFKKGARFDAWGNRFSFDVWRDAFRETNIDPQFYLRKKPTDELLPWDFVDVGINKDELIREFNKTIAIK